MIGPSTAVAAKAMKAATHIAPIGAVIGDNDSARCR